MVTTEQLRLQLGNMRRQEQTLEAQLNELQTQLQMIRGARQMLEHLLSIDESAAVSDDPINEAVLDERAADHNAVIDEPAFRRP